MITLIKLIFIMSMLILNVFEFFFCQIVFFFESTNKCDMFLIITKILFFCIKIFNIH